MRLKKFFAVALSATMVATSIPSIVASAQVNGISYTDAGEVFDNPERGFYYPTFMKMKLEGTKIPSYGLNANLVHLRVDIRDFAETEFTEDSLKVLGDALDAIQKNGGTTVVRFAYDSYFNANDIKEADMTLMRTHIKQLSDVLNKHEPVVACVECGMLGNQGELHGTQACSLDNLDQVISNWLEFLDKKITISVRTPLHYAHWAGVDVKDLGTVEITKNGWDRIGLYNDGYLGSNSDLGTYRDRKQEISWLKKQTQKLFFGGEMVAYYDKDEPKNTAKYMSEEGFKTHTTYLNIQWNDKAIAALKKEQINGESGFDYVSKHLGYRFTLINSDLSVSKNNKLVVGFAITNSGFGGVINDKVSTFIITNDKNTYEIPITEFDIRDYYNNGAVSIPVDLVKEGIAEGDYDVYLRISEFGNYKTDNNYNCIRFANPSSQWNETFGANKLGSFTYKKTSSGSSSSDTSGSSSSGTSDSSTSGSGSSSSGSSSSGSSSSGSSSSGSSNTGDTSTSGSNPTGSDTSTPTSETTEVSDKGVSYTVDSNSSSVEVEEVSNKSSIEIPEYIKIDGKYYKITKISKDAFENATKVKSITIGSNIKSIPKKVFSNCKKLTKITIGVSIKSIGKNAFKGTKLKTIVYNGTKSQFKKIKITGKSQLKNVKVKTKTGYIKY